MVFSSSIFLFIFFPIFYMGYILLYLCQKISPFKKSHPWILCNLGLLAGSLFFYGWYNPAYLWVLIFYISVNYIGGLLLKHKNRKSLMWLFVVLNLIPLIFFKYIPVYASAPWLHLPETIVNILHQLILPLGISFISFSGISYIVDVFRKPAAAEKSLIKLALYIGMFPKAAQGPIVQYAQIKDELSNRSIDSVKTAEGLQRFIIGLAKKVMLADTIGQFVDSIYAVPASQLSASALWLAALGYTLQIYFDFSGYSDMAIGIGKTLGFTFCENFDYPYISKSISEFWRRWHMSLQEFFKNYIYIPLGGNRKHVYLNLSIIFVLTGIWHGASFHFLFWGIWNGFFVVAERFWKHYKKKHQIQISSNLFVRLSCHIWTLLIVMTGWVFFRSSNLKSAIKFIKGMFIFNASPSYSAAFWLNGYTITLLVISAIACTPILKRIWNNCRKHLNEDAAFFIQNTALSILLVYCIMQLVSTTYSSFIYFQF